MVTNNSCDYQPTQYNVQTGGASGTLNNVAPSATSGVPVISQGSASQPIFGTAVVGGGGTGLTTATAYAVLCGGTTSTGAFQSIAGVGTSGQVLTSNGAAALPTFQAAAGGSSFSTIAIQSFTATGTYTPTASMKYCLVEMVGGGGAGGSGFNNAAGGGGSGGGGAEYRYGVFSAATIGSSQSVTIGAGATSSAGSGGNTSLGALMTANGGSGGTNSAGAPISGGAGGTGGSGGTVAIPGGAGGYANNAQGGYGGDSEFGMGAPYILNNGSSVTAGVNGNNYGSGGSGGLVGVSAGGGSAAGGHGTNGLVVVTEFI